MTFAQPIWFWALLLVPALGALYAFAEMRSKQMIARIVAPRLRNELAAGVSYAKRRLRTALMLLGLSALVTAMARPQWGYEWQEAKLKGRDVIVAVDVSKSMLANDLTPNRLTRARLATQDLLEMLEGDRLGLVAFAGSAFLQAPLTVDYGAVLSASQELDTDLIPRGGTNIASAIQTSLEAFGKGEGGDRALILFTDGEELDADSLKAAETAEKAGVKIFTVGVGSPEGSVIPMERRGGGTDFVRDRSNEIVQSKLDEGRLREIAAKTGGFYSRLEGASTIERIVKDGIKGLEETESETKMSKKVIDRYQWPLAVGIGFLMIASLIGDRRRRTVPGGGAKVVSAPKKMAGAALALAATLCCFHSSAKASETPESLYAAGKYKEALEAYEKSAPGVDSGDDKVSGRAGRIGRLLRSLSKLEPRSSELDFDIGAAAYKSEDYEKAMKSFSQVLLSNDEKLREKAYYNLGNTLFQKGVGKKTNEEKLPELESALQKYDDALRLNSENADAKHNRDVVAKYIDDLKKEQEQKKQDQKQDQQKQDQQKQDQQKQDQQKQDQQKQDQQKQDQQKQDQQKQDQQKQDQQKQEGQKKEDGQKEDQQPKDEPGQTGESKKDQQNQDQPGGGQDKKQEGQGDPKDEQKDGGKGDQEKKQDQAGKEQEKEKSEGEKGENEKKSEEGSQTAKNEPKEQKGSKGDQEKEKSEPGEEKGDKEEPAEAPEAADKPREGDLKAADTGEQKDGQDSGKMVQAAEESEERKGDGYTKTEARRLLDSLKNEEDRIMLFDKKWREPVYKDW